MKVRIGTHVTKFQSLGLVHYHECMFVLYSKHFSKHIGWIRVPPSTADTFMHASL